MRDYRDEDHMEEWRRQAIDDREYLIKQDMMSQYDCMDCIHRNEDGVCSCKASGYFMEEVSYGDVCEEVELYED